MYKWEIERLQKTANARVKAHNAMQKLGEAAIMALQKELSYNEEWCFMAEDTNIKNYHVLHDLHFEWNEKTYDVYNSEFEQNPRDFDKYMHAKLTLEEVLRIVEKPKANVFAFWLFNYKKNNEQSYTDFVESHKTKTATL